MAAREVRGARSERPGVDERSAPLRVCACVRKRDRMREEGGEQKEDERRISPSFPALYLPSHHLLSTWPLALPPPPTPTLPISPHLLHVLPQSLLHLWRPHRPGPSSTSPSAAPSAPLTPPSTSCSHHPSSCSSSAFSSPLLLLLLPLLLLPLLLLLLLLHLYTPPMAL